MKTIRVHPYIFLLLAFLFMVNNNRVMADIPAAFVDIGYGARPMGMGGAYTGLCDDVNAIFWNPAGLALLKKSELSVMYTKQFGLIPYGLAAYGTQIGMHHVAGGFITSGNDVLRETTLLGSYAGIFRLPLVGNTGVGVNLRFRHSSFGNNEDGGEDRIQGSAAGYGIDFGFLWQFNKRTRIGLFARDLVNSMSYNNNTLGSSYAESVPSALILGVSQKITGQSTMALDWEKSLYADTFDKLHLGAEITLLRVLICRGGVWQNLDAIVNRNYSFGMGLNMVTGNVGVQFDFAYLINDLAHTPRVSMSILH